MVRELIEVDEQIRVDNGVRLNQYFPNYIKRLTSALHQ